MIAVHRGAAVPISARGESRAESGREAVQYSCDKIVNFGRRTTSASAADDDYDDDCDRAMLSYLVGTRSQLKTVGAA